MDKECICCGSNDFSNIFRNQDHISGEVFVITQCKRCGLAKTAQPPVDLLRYYSRQYYGTKGKRFNSIVERMISLFRSSRAQFLINAMPVPGAILDIGCGRGLMLKMLKDKGWQTVGIEYSDELADYARNSLGLEIHVASDIKRCGFRSGSFDAVTMYHVLEHIQNPPEMISEIIRVLKPGGIYIVEVPHLYSIQSIITKGRWFHLDTPRHLYHFSKKPLWEILLKAGFIIEKANTHSLEFGYFGMIQSFLNLLCRKMNVLYDLLKNKSSVSRKNISADTLISLGLFLPIMLISIPLEFLASRIGKGGIIRIVARKVN